VRILPKSLAWPNCTSNICAAAGSIFAQLHGGDANLYQVSEQVLALKTTMGGRLSPASHNEAEERIHPDC
jgi:hypothetical protein